MLYTGLSRSMSVPPQAGQTEVFPWGTPTGSPKGERSVSQCETGSGAIPELPGGAGGSSRASHTYLARLKGQPISAPTETAPCVLLVEAERDLQVLLQQALEEESYRIMVAASVN